MVTKITKKKLGSVFIYDLKTRVIASFLLCVTVITAISLKTVGDSKEEAIAKTRAASSLVQETEENTISDPNKIVKYGTEEEKLLDSQVLSPMKTNEADVDAKVQEIFDEILDDSMSNYEKVLTIYLYIINNYRYYSSFITPDTSYVSNDDKVIVGRAKGFLTTGHGTCTEFSATFMVMMRALGYDAYCVRGGFSHSGGHTWCLVIMNGEHYVFDPQAEQYMMKNWDKGEYKGYYFCIDEEMQAERKYRPFDEEANIASFSGFLVAAEKTNSEEIQMDHLKVS